ncbi:MAG: penicillin-binding protein 1B [Saccharospirillum sp.]
MPKMPTSKTTSRRPSRKTPSTASGRPARPRPSASQRRKPTRGRASGPGRWARIRWRLFQLGLVLGALVVVWMIYLNAVVRERFEGQRFAIAARVYSEAQALYAGAPISADQTQQLLEALGYRRGPTASQPGRYSRNGQTLAVYTRGFDFWDGEEPAQRLVLTFDQGSLSEVRQVGGGAVLETRLDPLYLGQVYPGTREERVLVSLEEVPEELIVGLLAVEDRTFFDHWGVSISGIARALVANLRAGGVSQGGSTLTQQLVKNLYLTPERSLWRKANEALMALLMEWHYSKQEILETYINEVYLAQQGQTAVHGFGLGAQYFFGAPLQALGTHQHALLVGLIRGPSFYNPRRNPERAVARRNLVLDIWLEQGVITAQAHQEARQQPLDVSRVTGRANHHAFMDLVRRQLARDYRREDLLAEGLSIFTTLDPIAQADVERLTPQRLQQLEQGYGVETNALEAAVVVSRPTTGDVLALTGGRNPDVAGFNRALDARRPVGSLLKPAVYLAALEAGYSLATPISDAPVSVAGGDGQLWQPRNYDQVSHGAPLLVDALAHSYNQATARLGMEVGLPEVFNVMQRLGINSQLPAVPSVMLGAHGLAPIEMAQFYQTLANNGFYTPMNAIRAVTHPELGVLQRFELRAEQRFDPALIFLLNEALHEVTRNGTGRRLQALLPRDWWLAGKTGTTDDNRDAWFAGYSGERQVLVWVGQDNNEPTPLTGSSGALPLWADVMTALIPVQDRRTQPAGVAYVSVNDLGAGVPEACAEARWLPFVDGSQPSHYSRCNASPGDPEDAPATFWERLFGRGN